MPTTVRDAVLDVLRARGVDRIFANPGSTEVGLLAGLPDDLELVLALHEGSVVGLASGYAVASGRPSVALLHTAAGYGNAVGALSTARANRIPLVTLVGQQDRRHLASEPFLTGRLAALAGDYPVGVEEPARAADVPAAVARAFHAAVLRRGPAVVIVPMDDWAEPVGEVDLAPAAERITVATAADPEALNEVAALIEDAKRPTLVLGALADDPDTWESTRRLATALDAPVWQEAYAYRMGFDQTSPLFAGHLPPGRAALRAALSGHDLVLVLGGSAFRQYLYEPGAFVEPGTSVVVVTDDAEDAARSAAELVVLAPVGSTVAGLADRVTARAPRPRPEGTSRHPADEKPATTPHGRTPSPRDVFTALAERLPAESTYFEESPSTRRELLATLPVRTPSGFLTAAMGGLGFALPAAAGVKLARPNRPVVAVVGDGASLYNIQALWSARKYGAGVLYLVLSNGGYAVMDRLAANAGVKPPWPGFEEVSIATLASGFGCEARRIETTDELVAALDEVVPGLATRSEPLVLDVAVTTD